MRVAASVMWIAALWGVMSCVASQAQHLPSEGITELALPAGTASADARVDEWPLPNPLASPRRICLGPDGALWFTEVRAGAIGRITVDGELHEITLPSHDARPWGITTAPDGTLWVTEQSDGAPGLA